MEQNVNFTSDFPQGDLQVIKQEVQFEESKEHYENIEEYHGVKPKEELCDIEYLDITSSVKQEEITVEHEDELRRNEFDDKKDNIVQSSDSIKTEKADCLESSEKCDTENDVGQKTLKFKNELTEEIDNEYLDLPSLIKYEDIDIKDEVEQNRGDSSIYKCDQCDYLTKKISSLQKHYHLHKTGEEINLYMCDQCEFRTTLESCLTTHRLLHQQDEQPKETETYKCRLCDYVTFWSDDLALHRSTHGVKHKCDQCDYRTGWKTELKKHSSIHKNVYKCDQCGYQTLRKKVLLKHSFTHK